MITTYAGQVDSLNAGEVAALEAAAKLIGKEPQTFWTARELQDAFDRQDGTDAINLVLYKVRDIMGYTHDDVLASS